MATIMAGILGLVAVIIRPAIDGLGKCIGEPIKRKFNYLCCFNDNVKDLDSEAKKLGDAKYDVQSRVTTAQNNAQIVTPQVLSWLDEVNELQIKKPEIDTTKSGGCSTLGYGNYSMSKKVKEMAEAMKELRQESDYFTTISHPPPPEAMVPINIGSTIVFDSRKRIEDEIMSGLRDEGTNKVGICGMGGVGKTTMAKTIMQRARKELGFEEIVMAVVSQDVDKFKIQVDIATSLGLTLSAEGSLSSKAHELRTRLSAGTRRCLIVIDDVWEKLDLEELGIPYCSDTCKVVITSRNRHTLEGMDVEVEKLHAVQILSETEAWKLFKSKAGRCIEEENVVDVARHVVDECKGLPLALVTVGVALKNKAIRALWDNALKQLKSANPEKVPGVIKDVYQPLRLSYDFLEDDHQQSLFLMCCLFPEDSHIPLETLAYFCKGLLHMNEDIKSSRDATFDLVERLKDRFLLLQGKDEDHVKLHDVVRDVAIFIASEEKRIQCNECTWISPNIGERIGAHGGTSLFQNLRLLWIDCDLRDKKLEIDNDFFHGMRELKVLMIRCRSLKLLPETIGLLKNLQTLVLEECESLESISAVGKLVNLEILICRSCQTINSLPVQLEHLSRLTSLTIDIRDYGLAAEESRLPPNLLKFDITIGELIVNNSNSSWEKTMRLKLSRDINLKKWIHDCVRNVESLHLEGDGSRVVDLRVAQNLRQLDIILCSSIKKLVNVPFNQLEVLRLEKLNELEEICDISNFKKLTSITIDGCGKLRGLFSSTMMESGGCFLPLERLAISRCKMMEQVLMWDEEEQNQTNIIHIPKLKVLRLDDLSRLTSFIKGIESIEFPHLDEMHIENCPLLKDFVCGGDDNDPIQSSGPHKVKFGKLRKLEVIEVKNLCFHTQIDSFTNLTILIVYQLKDVKSLFSFSMTESLSQLEKLLISCCDMMEQVIMWKEEEENQMDIHMITLFPKLKDLSLVCLPRLASITKGFENIKFHVPPKLYINNCPLMESCASKTTDEYCRHLFCKPHHKIEFDRLIELGISGSYDEKMRRNWCPQIRMIELFGGVCRLDVSSIKGMESLFPCLVAQMMQNMKALWITECKEMVRVIEDKVDACETTPPILLFPNLEHLYLKELRKLESFCEWRCGLELPSLMKLDIIKCDVMKELTSTPLFTPNLQIIQIDNHEFKGKDVSSPILQLSSLRKQAEKEKRIIYFEEMEREDGDIY